MLCSLLSRFRQFRRQRRQLNEITTFNSCDAAALTQQLPPGVADVLVVRNDSIGDYLLYRPWLRQMSIVANCQGKSISLMANTLWAPLAQLWDGDILAEIIAVDFNRFSKDLAYRTKILQAIGKKGFAEVIYPLHVRQASVENFIRFMQAPVRIGSQGSHPTGPWFAVLDAGYTGLLPSTKQVLFEYYRNREFFEHWQAKQGILQEDKSDLLSEKESASLNLPGVVYVTAALEAAISRPYILLFPGASARQKRWPAKYFGQLARQLYQHYGDRYQLVIAGSAADTNLAQQIMRAAGPAVPLLNYCGRTDLSTLASLIAHAQLLVSNDTAAAHFAAQAGTRCLVLLMGENYGKFFPYPAELLRAPCRCLFPPSQESRFAQGDFAPPAQDPDISQIKVSRVLTASLELLPVPAS